MYRQHLQIRFEGGCALLLGFRGKSESGQESKSEKERETGWGIGCRVSGVGRVFKAHRLMYHATLGLRVMKKKRVYRTHLQIRFERSCALLFGFRI